MGDVTQILLNIESADPGAAEKLLPLVYQELRRLAAQRMTSESSDHTLQATALVHEAYVRLVDLDNPRQWNGRGHFFSAAAEAMRRILVENARRKQCLKHGGHMSRIQFDEKNIDAPRDSVDVIALDEALENLAIQDPRKAELVKLRYFAGMTITQAANALGIANSTADADWAYAKSWLQVELSQ